MSPDPQQSNNSRSIVTIFKKILFIAFGFFAAAIILANTVILISTKKYIFININDIHKSDTGIILGASVYKDRVSVIVKDRIDTAVDLYKTKKIKRILITGDGTEKFYNEVSTIKLWLNKNNIPDRDILMDNSGISTYESIIRAESLFKVKKAVIISQEFHLPRAIFIAHSGEMEAQGLCADRVEYQKAGWYEFREIFARLKDFILCVL